VRHDNFAAKPRTRATAAIGGVLNMYIEKIEIPAFRVLRGVTLDFGGGYDPKVFPVGSENGGGKSTLLQLVFTLLHCSFEPSRRPYLQNLLASDSFEGDEGSERIVARLTVRVNGQSHALEFVSLHDRFLRERLDEPPAYGFATQDRIRRLVRVMSDLERVEDLEGVDPSSDADAAQVERMKARARRRYARLAVQEPLLEEEDYDFPNDGDQTKIDSGHKVVRRWQEDAKRVKAILVALNYALITTHSTAVGDETRALVCRSHGESASEVEDILAAVSAKVFLLGPSNQQYLFLDKDARKALLGTPPQRDEREPRLTKRQKLKRMRRPQIEYLDSLDDAERAMDGFYAYDWLSFEPLVRLFALARDEDFKQVVNTGSYGENYTRLMREVNGLLLGKKVRPFDDLEGVEFIVVGADGNETPLRPEDLSQGELKRLMIYAWLRASNAVDAVVLIDEIEASFHPDWQVGIVRDLQDWSPGNQYILATHSYDLCQALTPRHVRELQPQLRRGESMGDGAMEPESNDG